MSHPPPTVLGRSDDENKRSRINHRIEILHEGDLKNELVPKGFLIRLRTLRHRLQKNWHCLVRAYRCAIYCKRILHQSAWIWQHGERRACPMQKPGHVFVMHGLTPYLADTAIFHRPCSDVARRISYRHRERFRITAQWSALIPKSRRIGIICWHLVARNAFITPPFPTSIT